MIKPILCFVLLSIALFFSIPSRAATHLIEMRDNSFLPNSLTIQAGDTVTWTNRGFNAHDSVSGANGIPNGIWQGPLISRNQSWSFTFSTVAPGTYPYFCTPHRPAMTGTIIVNPAPNTAPTISAIADQVTNEDAPTAAIPFTIGDAETAPANLTLTRGSTQPGLIPVENIIFGGAGANRTVTLSPLADQFGTASITITVSDGTANASRTFLLTVNAVNDPPTLAAIGDLVISQNAAAQTVNLSGIGTGAANEIQTLTVTAVSGNPGVVPHPQVSYASPGAEGTLSLAPAPNASGSALITVTVQDDGGTANGGVDTVSRSFTVTVEPLPTIALASPAAAGGQFRFTAHGLTPGKTNIVEASFDLLGWTPIGTNVAAGSSQDVSAGLSGNLRFFRVLQVQ